MGFRGWDVFHTFYGNKDQPMPISNAWKLNLGRLVVPNVFIEPMLIRELARKFNPPSCQKPSRIGYFGYLSEGYHWMFWDGWVIH